MHRLRALLLLVILVWQSVAMLGPVTVAQRADGLAHMAVHLQEASHHHHADETLHLDGGNDAVPHFHADSGSSPTGLLTSSGAAVMHLKPTLPLEGSPLIWHAPTLEGPLRPPMPRA